MATENDVDAFESAAQSQSQGSSTSAGIPASIALEDASDAPTLRVQPKVMFDAERIVQFDTLGTYGIKAEQNIANVGGDAYVDGFVVTVENPSFVIGSLWRELPPSEKDEPTDTDDEDWTPDYYLVDEENSNVEVEHDIVETDDGPEKVETGVRIFGREKEAERVEYDDFTEQYVTIYGNGSGGRYMAGRLDTAGGEAAEDGVGLFEYPPEHMDDMSTRVARSPTLRADLVDQPVRFLIHEGDEYNGNATKLLTPFHLNDVGDPIFEDGEPVAYTRLERGDDNFDDPEYNPYTVWDDERDVDGEPTEGDIEDDTPDFDFGDDEDTTEELTYDDLGETGQTFVDQLNEAPVTIDELDDFAERVEDAKAEGLDESVTAEDMERIIRSQ